MTIYMGADHNGFDFKRQLMQYLQDGGYTVVDGGNAKLDPADDFPEFAGRVVSLLKGDADPNSRGILICGSGQGMCMAANRFPGMRASLCWSVEEAHAARNDDDSNILCLPSRYLTLAQIEPIVTAWLHTSFAGAARFKRRIQKLDELV